MHFLGYSHSHDDDAQAGGISSRFWLRLALAALVALACWLLARTVFFVDETEYVYVTQFGEPLRLETEPGLRLKRPYQSLWRFDRRLQMYEPPGREMLTEDKENLDFEWYVCWRIPGPGFVAAELVAPTLRGGDSVSKGGRVPSPSRSGGATKGAEAAKSATAEDVKAQTEQYVRRYLQTVGGKAAAESRLEERIQAAIAAEIGRTRLAELASLAPDGLKLEAIMQRITESIRQTAIEQFGIEVVDVRLKRFNYPQAVKPAVFAEIRSERERVAVQYRAEGESEKTRIESQATLERDRLLAQAQRDATQMRGDGEAKAMEILNAAHGKNPAFYQLLKTLETYRSILDEQTTIVLSADSPLLKLLSHGLPEPAEMPGRPSSTVEAGEEPVPTKVQAAPTVPAAQKKELPQSPSPQASAGPAATTQGAAP